MMKTKSTKILLHKSNLSVLIFVAFLFLAGCTTTKKEHEEQLDMSVEVLPKTNSVLWGYQMISIYYDYRRDLSIKQIFVKSEEGKEPLITEDNLLYSDPGVFEVSLCAECFNTPDISITVEFEGEKQEPITRNYTINKMPIIEVSAEQDSQEVILNAGYSKDPEGQKLTFQWYYKDSVFTGPKMEADIDIIQEQSILLEVSDGVTTVFDLISIDPVTDKITYTPDKLRCTDLKIVTKGKSLLNPTILLGPNPSAGTQLPVDENMRVSRRFKLGFTFEVRGTIEPQKDTLDEGQDAAASSNYKASDPTKEKSRRGPIRKKTNRSDYIRVKDEAGKEKWPKDEFTPFPDPLPPPGTHPRMSTDNYDDHPLKCYVFKNTDAGGKSIEAKKKGLCREGTKNMMVWIDGPGMYFHPNHDLSKGCYFKVYFRSWMIPDIPPCQKFFIIEIEVDNTGMVTKNELTMR